MIGFFGIIADEKILAQEQRENAFKKMLDFVDQVDFSSNFFSGENYSIGVTVRRDHENKDLAIKKTKDGHVIAFSGYGKLTDERKLSWAIDFINKVKSIYDDKGVEALTHIEGSFQCLICDGNEFVLINDRLGSKPLFYYHQNDILIFGSDVGRLLRSGIIPFIKNYEAVKEVLISGFFLENATLVKHVFRFPFATRLTKSLDKSRSEMENYWELPSQVGTRDQLTNEIIDEFTLRFDHAISELSTLEPRSIVQLSGGLDSRAIACFLSNKQKINTITYDMKDEASIAKKVSKKLAANFYYFSNEMLLTNVFKSSLQKYIIDQNFHTVLNQYFYIPLFKVHFRNFTENPAIYDGMILDVLFSDPHTGEKVDFHYYSKTYGGNSKKIISNFTCFPESEYSDAMENIFSEKMAKYKNFDDLTKSQLLYIIGRFRRYVLEAINAKENFCYTLLPCLNYQLMDFGFSLNFDLRRGKVYNRALFEKFPEVMKIKYIDSYGNRKMTQKEKLQRFYKKQRIKLSSSSRGLIKYSPYQTDYFFIRKGNLKAFQDLFLNTSDIPEIIDMKSKSLLFNQIRQKPYLFNLFQRLLFIEQFYKKIERKY